MEQQFAFFFPITRHSNFICHDLTMQMKGHLYEVHLLLWQKKKDRGRIVTPSRQTERIRSVCSIFDLKKEGIIERISYADMGLF